VNEIKIKNISVVIDGTFKNCRENTNGDSREEGGHSKRW
jgi:hypothetical protein